MGLEDLLREQQVENQLLEKEVDLLEEHVKEIRNTVWFSLGVIITVLITIVFYNWITTNKLYEKDKQRLIDLIKYDTSNSLSKLSVENEKELIKTERILSNEIEDQIVNLERFKANLSSFLGHNFMEDSKYDHAVMMYSFTFMEFLLSKIEDHEQLDTVIEGMLEIYKEKMSSLSETSQKMILIA
ncbi:MAG: hypothetical protein BalsKO_23720 [Balneolaceae bacterium]